MNEEIEKTENAEDTTVEETSPSEVQEEVQAPDQDETQSQEQDVDAQPTEQEQVKPTRAERRVQQLLEKMKAQKSQGAYPDVAQATEDESLITPEEYESGIDPKVLEARAIAREQRKLQQSTQSIKQQLKAEMAYEQIVKEHEADLEIVSQSEELKKNSALERMAVRLYEKENYLVDPRTGQTFFNPVVKLSEALEIVKRDLAEATGVAMADVRIKANENRETVALTPSQEVSSVNGDYTEAFEKARMSGDDQSWAEVLRKRGL